MKNKMNVVWSKYVQGINTLYYSRKLRFNDHFADQFMKLFDLPKERSLKILEIGCGPGALAGALHRWYPHAEITGIDRDSAFVRFASEHEADMTFMEGDATALPFSDNTFDVTISNTVAEHIEPSRFYGEPLRVLKPGGICLVLSSRRGINIQSDCASDNEYERSFWEKAAKYDDSMERFAVCRYPMSEAEIPAAMARYGFDNVRTGYAVADLTPDDPKYSADMALDMINANRYNALDAIESVMNSMPERFDIGEIEEMRRMTNAKYDERIRLYNSGEKQWDTNVSIIMVIRGMKSTKIFEGVNEYGTEKQI